MDASLLSLKALFDDAALQYDRNREKVIPCFRDFYGTLVRLIPFDPAQRFNFLDLGAGTGLVSALIFNAFPHAEGTLLDISEKMLEQARKRFKKHPEVRFLVADYDAADLNGPYNLIVSAMSIHHLSDTGKQLLTQRIFEALESGGVFIHAELVKGPSQAGEDIYQQQWQAHLKQTGLGEKTLNQIRHRMSHDRPATLEAQLAWMKSTGFDEVDCYYKYFNFAVYAGRKN